jgi:hypothetical protein
MGRLRRSVLAFGAITSMSASIEDSLGKWISHVFDHSVTDPAWHWSGAVSQWQDSPEHIAMYIASTFERAGELLARFTDEQLNQGFWYLVSNSCSEAMFALVDSSVPLSLRLRALRSFVPVFEQVMARRCSSHLSYIDEPGANPLNSACYMWWDILPIHGRPDLPERAEFDAEVLVVLERLLAIPHDACRESALHGIGHWSIYYAHVARAVEDFLAQTPNLRPELVTYAQSAKVGGIL